MSIALHPRLPLTDIPDPLSLQYPFDMHQLVVKVMSQTKCGKRDPTANVFPRTCLLWRDIDRSDQLQEYAEPPIVIPFKKDVHLQRLGITEGRNEGALRGAPGTPSSLVRRLAVERHAR